jgi:hypothetical protein
LQALLPQPTAPYAHIHPCRKTAVKQYPQMLLSPLEEAMLIDGDTHILLQLSCWQIFTSAFWTGLQTCGLERQTTFSAVQLL